jgi:hypothetical protein
MRKIIELGGILSALSAILLYIYQDAARDFLDRLFSRLFGIPEGVVGYYVVATVIGVFFLYCAGVGIYGLVKLPGWLKERREGRELEKRRPLYIGAELKEGPHYRILRPRIGRGRGHSATQVVLSPMTRLQFQERVKKIETSTRTVVAVCSHCNTFFPYLSHSNLRALLTPVWRPKFINCPKCGSSAILIYPLKHD